MKKKVLALTLSVLSLVPALSLGSSAASISDEILASQIQKEIMKDTKHSKINREIARIQAKISEKKAEIKRLEKVRNELDHDLAVQYQLLEVTNSYYKIQSINREIGRIQSRINSNENRIKQAKRAITSLDHDLAVQYQLKELY